MRQKKARTFKLYTRLTEEQRAKLDKRVEQARGRAGQVDFMSAAFDLYDWAADRYPIGVDLLPQIPQLVNDRRSSPKAVPPRAKKRKP